MKKSILSASLVISSLSFAEPISDNSFMIEEAYNQEAGVYQHIFYYEAHEESAIDASFTEEFPLGSQDHQGAISIPYQQLANPSDDKGLGDVSFQYRYQLLNKDQIAMAPSMLLSLPTGDHKKNLGTGATGVEFKLPISVVISPFFTTHLNVGYSFTPNAKSSTSDKADIHGTSAGASIIYNYTDNLNFMAEYFAEYEEGVIGEDAIEGGTEMWFNPGLRYGFNFDNSQLVAGIAYLNGVGPSAGQTGASFYLSFEH